MADALCWRGLAAVPSVAVPPASLTDMPVLTNARHERFAQELASGKSLLEAHAAAGYSPNRGNAATLKQTQSILDRINEILSEREQIHAQSTAKAIERVSLTKEWVIARLVENAERALQARQAMGPDGEPVGDFKYDGMVANRALELLGKELGMFIDRKEIGAPGEFADMDDAALLDRAKQEALELGVPLSDTAH